MSRSDGVRRHVSTASNTSAAAFPALEQDTDSDLDANSESGTHVQPSQNSSRPIQRTGTLSKDFTEDEEKAVLKKLDRNLVLFLAFLYLLSFLDRSSEYSSAVYRATPNRSRYR